MTRLHVIAVVACTLCGCSSDQADDGCDGTRVRITSASGGGKLLDVCAARAVTEEERVKGLTGTESLPASAGLLLEFPLEGEACIQNGTVTFAIDVVYASDQGEVMAVEHAVPAGDASVRCHTGVRRVLEVTAGVAAAVEVGDHLTRS